MIPPYTMIHISAPNIHNPILVIFLVLTPLLAKNSPARKPTSPMANICHGVHGPCPIMKLDTNIDIAPTTNPPSQPNAAPEIMTIAMVGLKFGTIKNAALPATARAHITARVTISLVCGLRFSNETKNGIIASIIIKRHIK